EVSRGCASHGAIMSVNNSLYCEPVAKFGTDEQKRRFLSLFAAGQKLGCFSLTEPEAGSVATNQSTLARRYGEAHVLDGRKIFVPNGTKPDPVPVFPHTDRPRPLPGISLSL